MRKMKDSGIEWIGEIPENWEVMKNKYILSSMYSGGTPGSNNADFYTEADDGVPFVSISDMSTTSYIYKTQKKLTLEGLADKNLKILPAGTILYSIYATIGAVSELKIEAAISQAMLALGLKNNVSKQYYKYCLSAMREYVFGAANGNTQFNLNAEKVWNYIFPIPSAQEQEKITNYLDKKCAEIDAIIAAKEKTNELLKERRQSIIYEAITKGLDPTVPMKDSGIEWIGEIPESWDVCPVKYVIDKNHPYPVGDGDHGLIKADDYLDEGIPYIRVLNLTWGEGLNLENLVYISDEMNSRIKNSELKPNDILIAKTGATIGKTAIVPDSLPRSNTTSHVGKITISSDHDAVFFYYVMTSSIVQRQIQVLSAMQSTRPELGIDGLRNLLVVVPPVEKQRDISEFLNQQCAEINAVIDTNSSMIDKLKEYRQSVIYEAVTGKVEI